MESGSLPIIQNSVPEMIYGGYAPQSLYKERESDSGFYDLFIRQINGPEAEFETGKAAADRMEAGRQAEMEARQKTADLAGKAETDKGVSSKEGEVREGAGSGADEEASARAGVSEERGLNDDREDGNRKAENLKPAAGESEDEGKKSKQVKFSSSSERETAKKLQPGEIVKAAGDNGENRGSVKEVFEKNHTEIFPENKESLKNDAGKKEKKKSGLKGEEILVPGVIEINASGKDHAAGEKKLQDSNRKIKEKSELLKTAVPEKGRVVIEDRRSVKSLDTDGRSAEWKKDGGNAEKQNIELRNTMKDELLDKNEKILRVGNEQLEKLQDNLQRGRALTSGRSVGQPHGSELLRQLKESGNRQIVKHTGIILKDNNSGEIKLVLKPENLGNVRIRLQLNENSITGKVLVDNQMVRAAFEQNLEALYKAFKESGFESASLDVQVGGEAGHGKGKKEGGEPEYAAKKIKFLEEQIPLTKAGNFADTIIDLVV